MIDPLTQEPITREELLQEIKLIRCRIETSNDEYEEIVWLNFLKKREELLRETL